MTITKSQAISEVFITAFRSLSSQERAFVLEKLLVNDDFNEDISDVIIAWQRQKEKSIPYKNVRTELKKAGRL